MKNTLFKNWNFMRVIRLVIGLVFIAQGIDAGEWIIIFLGGLIALMPILNVGCSSGSCQVNPTQHQMRKSKDAMP